MKKKILALTGIRSEYDLLYPLLKAIDEDKELELGIIVAGAHLSPLHNFSVKQIEKDNLPIVERIYNLLYSDSLNAKAKSAAILMQSMTQTLERENPDFLMVLGDREEAIVGAIVASYMNIPIIHLAGGDHTNPIGGNVDEQVRHATTKLSHIHFTMREEHTTRILKLGEESWRVHTVGSGGIDRIRVTPILTKKELVKALGERVLDSYAVVIHHPLNSQVNEGAHELEQIFETLIEENLAIYVGYPNSDPGFDSLIKVINKYEEKGKIITYKNLDRVLFVNLLRNAQVLVGNSSLGLHEAPYLCLPAINIGERQVGRLSGKNVQFVNADKNEIKRALDRALKNSTYKEEIVGSKDIYGDGYMAQKCVEIIKKLPNREVVLAKKMEY
ncbi:UDP-N-acetylglucosamine 2-epimerase [Lysinibacillus sp. OL1_EC]|uniref:UDP-N-acetylglucosamine 2-epimerase n=1 Tax=unclassified Lysinibacillus TaxID=2636778 RepID=UPI00103B1D79|nr:MULTISPECIES: UDP-N-acetylglucosamine 2-epimerase [unclassified Lysinibacillus]MCM0626386.1 UDP-N-acetylglucosamine 2-epimerase [Lysinibacillus sp. OL1_EC]TBV85746.1 UDP-N-acetylglucosamine 2-epimerase (hydrolyzing) [Lysinibacillus sp. OL1]